MPPGEFVTSLTAGKAKEKCAAHLCPSCGTDHQVTVEQVLRGDQHVIWCHCRACGHSWHPVVQEPQQKPQLP